jgi:hypothetical protein
LKRFKIFPGTFEKGKYHFARHCFYFRNKNGNIL